MRLVYFVAALLSAPSVMAAQPKVAVLDVSATGIEKSLVPMLTEVLTVEVDALHRYQVVAGSDVRALLGFEQEKDLFECEDASCLAEIGGALGVQKLVVANIGRLGSTYVVNIKLIDIKKVVTEGRVYETVKGEVDMLLQTIRNGVRRMFAEASGDRATDQVAAAAERPLAAPASAGDATPATSSMVARAQPASPADSASAAPAAPPGTARTVETGQRRWTVPIILWSAGAAALGAGTYFGISAKQHYQNAVDAGVIGRQTDIDPGKRDQLLADIAFGVSAAAAVSGLAVWFFGGSTPASVAVVPTDGGAALVSSFAFDL